MPDHEVIFEDEVLASGFTQVWNHILLDPLLSVESRLLYIIFCHFAWKSDSCFPGQETLGEIMGVNPRRIRDYIHELSEVGLITVRQRGLGKTNVYVIHAPVTKSRPVINDRSEGAVKNDRSRRSKMTGHARARVKGFKNTQNEEYDENFIQDTENLSHEEQDHNLESDPEDSHINPASSMNGNGESKTIEPPPQIATDQPADREAHPYSKKQQAGKGSEQKQRLAAKKNGHRYPKTPPPPSAEKTSRHQRARAATESAVEVFLANHR